MNEGSFHFYRYDSEQMHVRFLARMGWDSFVGLNPAVNMAFTYIADIPLVDEIFRKWEPALAFAAKKGHFRYTVFCVWPVIHDSRLLERVLSMSDVAWDVPENHATLVSTCTGKYSIHKDGRDIFYHNIKTAQCLVKGLIATRLPHLVEGAELSDFLLTAEAQFGDLMFQICGSTGLPLSLLCSLVAQHLGDKKLASKYAKVELIGNLNPLKQTLAQLALAGFQSR
jgi:hypothetical protein